MKKNLAFSTYAYSEGITEWRCTIACLLMLGVALALAFIPEKYYPQRTLRRVVSTCFLLISSIITACLSFDAGLSDAYVLLLAVVLATSASAIMLLERYAYTRDSTTQN